MANAQTKVTRSMKTALAEMRTSPDLKHALIIQDPVCSVYTAIVNPVRVGTKIEDATFVRISVARQGNTEEKFKKRAGLFFAAQRAGCTEGIVVHIRNVYHILDGLGLGGVEGKPFYKLG